MKIILIQKYNIYIEKLIIILYTIIKSFNPINGQTSQTDCLLNWQTFQKDYCSNF